MGTPQVDRSASRDRGVSDSFTIHPRAGSERQPTFHGPSTRGTDENRSPATLPRAFEGMLKTTTETGDIGMFSIKPPRVPQSLSTPRRIGGSYNDNGLQKPGQIFQPFEVPNVDDRRRLPSYARDTTSEVISMYETASQKTASRVFDDPDYRSYSMTQTSYSAYTLSNHRSYASLRSHQDSNGLLQRPRSPFAYPTRLKRPGFRQSSPALTDGCVVDYSRRAETDRSPYGPFHTTSSPSSLYALKRKPPLSLRQEANRSTPSLMSQQSPPRRFPSPALRQSNGNLANEWTRRIGSTSGNTSPARSTFSLASTVNLYATVAPTSSITTPGKLAPSSPLYYDYTEDFEVDSYKRPAETLGSPPRFSIDKTIPEERPMSAERSALSGSNILQSSTGAQDFPSPGPTVLRLEDRVLYHRTTLPAERHLGRIQHSLDETTPGYYSPVKEINKEDEKKAIRLSDLGYGARELSTHVEEAFGLLPTTSFEICVSQNDSEEIASGFTNDPAVVDQVDKDIGKNFTRIPSCSGGTHPPRVSSLPALQTAVQYKSRKDASTTSGEKKSIEDTLLDVQTSYDPIQLSQPSNRLNDHPMRKDIGSGQLSNSTLASSSEGRARSSSGFKSTDTGFTEVTNHIKTLEDPNRARNLKKEQQVLTDPESTPMFSPNIQGRSVLRNACLGHNLITSVSSFNQSSGKDNHLTTQPPPLKRTLPCSGSRKVEVSALGLHQRADVPNFSHHMTMKAIPRSGSPMLAPKPISPARQLKLKNSVPQLMKALPPLPLEPPVRALPPPDRPKAPEYGLPCRFSPLLPEFNAAPVEETPHGHPVAVKEEGSKVLAEIGSASNEATCTSTLAFPAQILPIVSDPPPRLKLKMRKSASLQPLSSPNSKAWNREENNPWLTSDSDTALLAAVQAENPTVSNPPKFRLKISRASGSTSETVRINRESGESNAGAGFHLRNHKDLFTSAAGIDNIFQQVSQHLHSRKASSTSNNESESHPASTSTLSPGPYPTSVSTSPTTKPLPSTEARSVFSDDSSHIQNQPSMRGRFSNLRARIAVSYVNRIGSQSYDDLTWRDRNKRGAAAPMAKRSISISHTPKKSTEARPLRRFAEKMQNHRLKERVQGWFMEARSAIASRMKSRSTARADQVEARV